MAEIFVVAPPRTFWRDVPIHTPDGSAARIDIEWCWMDKAELEAWTASMRASPGVATLAKAINGWRGVLDENEKPIPFSAESLLWLCGKYPSAPLHLFLGYLDAMSDGRRKN